MNRVKRTVKTDKRLRLSVYRSLNNFYAQIIDDETGRTLASANSLKSKGSLTEKARAVAKSLALAAKEKKIKNVYLDRRRFAYKGTIKIFAETAREAGLNF